jgi:hypothetical protein
MNMNTPIFIIKYVSCVLYENLLRKQNQWIKEMISFLWRKMFKEKKQDLSNFYDQI